MTPTRLGWFGAVAYALPIIEVWLITETDEHGTTPALVVAQVVWGVALVVVLDRCVRGSRAYRAARAQAEADARAVAEREALALANGGSGAGSGDDGARGGPPPHPPRLRLRSGRSSADRRRSHR